MRVIELDAQSWKSYEDFAVALRTALGSPKGHGLSVEAFLDSMVWGGMNEVNPPYKIVIKNTKHLSKKIADAIDDLRQSLPRPGAESNNGADIFFEIIP